MKIRQIPLFYPNVTKKMRLAAFDALGERIIGQGDTVEKFEEKLVPFIGSNNILSLNSATSALELSYDLLSLKPGDEVITPVFTCTATNIPLARRGVKIIFADVDNSLRMDWKDVHKKITSKTKAIVNAHLFGQLNLTPPMPVPVVGDAAQYLGKTKNELFTAYSFQATKILTTVDGGALVCRRKKDYKRAKLLRWYGINRESNKENIDSDIRDPGYKYHMNNVSAAIGIAGLKSLSKLAKQRKSLQKRYEQNLGVKGGTPYLIHTNNRDKLRKKLATAGVESGLVHKRNDIYSIFGAKRQNLPNMNRLENTYMFLPCHNHMNLNDVDYICSIVKNYI